MVVFQRRNIMVRWLEAKRLRRHVFHGRDTDRQRFSLIKTQKKKKKKLQPQNFSAWGTTRLVSGGNEQTRKRRERPE